MAVIVIPSRWQRQPTGPVEIDWNHGMAGDLIDAFCGGRDVDLTQPATPVLYSNTATAQQEHTGTEYGVARRVGGVSGYAYWQIQRRGVNSATTGLTAWGRVCPLANPSNAYFALARNSASRSFGWAYEATTRKLSAYLRTDGGTAYTVPGSRTISAYDWHDAGSVLVGTSISLYDGGGFAVSGTVASGTTPTRFAICDSSMGAFLVPVCYLWAGAHPEYMPELSRNPWQVFKKRLYKFVSLGGGTIYNESISESASASDSLSALAVFGGALSESASAADTLAASAALAGALSEAASAADVVAAAAAFAGALSEAASASDDIDASIGAATYAVALDESVSASDVLAASAQMNAAMSESASASDALSAASIMVGQLSESVSPVDAIAASGVLAASINESATAADVLSSSAVRMGALSESASAADSIDAEIGAVTYAAELVESVSAADSYTAAAVFASEIVEAVTAQDAVTAAAVLSAVLAEVASADDAVAGSLVLAGAIAEAVSAADGWVGAVGSQVFEAELSEAVAAGDVFATLGVLARYGVRGAQGVQSQMRTRSNIQAARRYN